LPRLGGQRRGRGRGPLPPGGLPRGLDGGPLDPDRRQLRQRPLRLQEGRGHRGPHRSRAGHPGGVGQRGADGPGDGPGLGARLPGGALPGLGGRLASAGRGPSQHRRGLGLHRRALAVGLPRAGRSLRLHLLRPGGGGDHLLPPHWAGDGPGLRPGGPRGAHRHRHPGGEQPAGHRHRPEGGQADPGRPPGRPGHPLPVRPLPGDRLPGPRRLAPGRLGGRRLVAARLEPAPRLAPGPDRPGRNPGARPQPGAQGNGAAPPPVRAPFGGEPALAPLGPHPAEEGGMGMATGWPTTDWLHWRARHAPEREALRFQGRSWTFAQLDEAVTRLALRLAALGLEPGDRLAVLLGSGPLMVQVVHGVGRRGVELVPLNTRLAGPELAWQVADGGAKLLLYDETTAAAAEAVAREVPGLRAVAAEELEAVRPQEIPLRLEREPGQIHTIIYTSGTTGRPKGARLTYGNYGWNALA